VVLDMDEAGTGDDEFIAAASRSTLKSVDW